MNFPFYIARRYLFSKKSTHAINVISAISAVGVAVATMALIVTLSVFNGFHDLVATFFTSFDPQIEVVPAQGKTAPADDPVLQKIRQMPQVEVATECLKDQALAIYRGKQTMVTLMGVDNSFEQMSRIDEILYGEGAFILHAANLNFGIVGARLAETLGMNANWDGSLLIYAPRKTGQLDMANPSDGFVVDSLISPGSVLIVASFNIIGSISMLIIDKKNDVVTLRNLGATDKQIKRIFLFEGRLISFLGAMAGLLLGLLLCWLQQQFGLVALGQSSGTFVVDAYPVSVHPEDVVAVFVTVVVVGFLAVWYPVRYFSRRLIG